MNNKFSYRVELKPYTVFIFATNKNVKIRRILLWVKRIF
jgi:hypothetical protein